jgi:hypothetical protein
MHSHKEQTEHMHRERRYLLDNALCPEFESAKSVLKVHTSQRCASARVGCLGNLSSTREAESMLRWVVTNYILSPVSMFCTKALSQGAEPSK